MNDDESQPRVIYSTGPIEWTVDCHCQVCGWPWRFYGVSESRMIDVHKTVKCPNCGASHTIDFHHE